MYHSHCNKIYVSSTSNVSSNHWCTCTVNKTEAKLYDFLISNYDVVVT